MADSRCSCGQGNAASGNRETVCIDTMRVLDSCRDRDCYEDNRVYLTAFGQELIDRTSTVRTVCADIIGTSIGVSTVPFNSGFYQINIRFYLRVRCEACLGGGRSQEFCGLTVLEKNVVLYGSEGNASIFRSTQNDGFCAVPDFGNQSDNLPVAVVETVAPIVLSTKVAGPECHCNCCNILCGCTEGEGLPSRIADAFPEGLPTTASETGNRLIVSIGMFSVVRIERPAQFLISATEYSVPDKECVPTNDDEDPCRLFRNMAFPVHEFSPPSLSSRTRTRSDNCNR